MRFVAVMSPEAGRRWTDAAVPLFHARQQDEISVVAGIRDQLYAPPAVFYLLSR